MKIRLDGSLVTTVYYYTLQAERSIDKVLGNDWSDFREYYRGERADAVQQIIDRLKDLLSRHGFPLTPPSEEELARSYPSLGLFQYLFGKVIARWKKRWSFPGHEVCSMTTNLVSVLQLLDAPTKPDNMEVLVPLRIRLCHCRSMIENRCYGLAVLQCRIRIEHLYQSDWIRPIKLTEILGQEQGTDVAATRRSA